MTYRERLKARILRSLEGRPRTLVEIIRSSAGAYPTLVAECLTELHVEIKKTHEDVFALHDSSYVDGEKENSSLLSHIEGNPVLCSWYFTEKTCTRLENLQAWGSSRFAFLGTPRLYEWYCQRRIGASRILLDLDPLVAQELSKVADPQCEAAIRYDIADEIPLALQAQADFVFLDPPWYPEVYGVWLRRAAQLACGGTLLIPLFPELTRPNAPTERTDLLARLRKASQTVFLLQDFVDYTVPTFEEAHLESLHLGCLGAWKVADLLIAKLSDRELADAFFPAAGPYVGSSTWAEIDVGSMRLFVNTAVAQQGAGLLSPSTSGSLLRSPSRRDPKNANINVLTSRGHGLRTAEPARLLEQLQEIAAATRDGRSVSQVVRTGSLRGEARSLLLTILGGV
ncbi:MAG TPA: hypothetical protein VOA80_01035 [Thermoanaerobaculia bacterium]|nr:hypothetical protein [Thermoanaerobaculia bacterium]